jgi:drug/metabolite transporter (DMT)-like permease
MVAETLLINLSNNLLQKDFDTPKTNQTSNNSQEPKYNESTSLLLFMLATTCYGISNFQLKYIHKLFGETYDVYSFGLWRMVFFTFLIKQIINYKKIEIIPLTEMDKQTLFWLAMRTFGQFLSLLFFMGSLENLRVGTANCFVSMNPAAVLIFSTIFLKEKFHWRYPIGIAICFSGVLIIISNELKSINDNGKNLEIIDERNKKEDNFGKILLGIFWGSLNLITVAMLSISTKFLNRANVGQENQCFYIGISNAACFFLCILLNWKINISVGFIFISATNSVIFLLSTFIIILALQGVDLNKTIPLNYNTIVVSTFLSCIFLGEPLYFTDVLGSLIILGYNIFNSLYPVKD